MSRYFDLVTQSNNLNIKLCYLRYTVHVQEHTKKKKFVDCICIFFPFFSNINQVCGSIYDTKFNYRIRMKYDPS